jgi:calmodulin
MLSRSDLHRFQNLFDVFDEDKDGFIQPSVLEQALRSLGLNLRREEFDDILFDVKKRPISFGTFSYIAYHCLKNVDVTEDMISAFRVLDRAKTGRLGVETVRRILQTTRTPFTESQIEHILSQWYVEDDLVDYSGLVNSILEH